MGPEEYQEPEGEVRGAPTSLPGPCMWPGSKQSRTGKQQGASLHSLNPIVEQRVLWGRGHPSSLPAVWHEAKKSLEAARQASSTLTPSQSFHGENARGTGEGKGTSQSTRKTKTSWNGVAATTSHFSIPPWVQERRGVNSGSSRAREGCDTS